MDHLKRFLILYLFVFTMLCGCSSNEEKKVSYFEKGKAYFEKGEYKNAEFEFKNAIQIDPEYISASARPYSLLLS